MTFFRYGGPIGSSEEDNRVTVEIPGTRIHVTKTGDDSHILYVYDRSNDAVAAFNEWAYAEVIKDEVTFVRHEDGVLVPPAG